MKKYSVSFSAFLLVLVLAVPSFAKLKITVLAENSHNINPSLINEFGFSALVEYGDERVIFDTAKAGGMLPNAEQMGLDLEHVDVMMLSHAHYDHCGGVLPYYDKFGVLNKKLFVSTNFFKYSDNKYYEDRVGRKFDFTDGTKGFFSVSIKFNEEALRTRGVEVHHMTGDTCKLTKDMTIHTNFLVPQEVLDKTNMFIKNVDKYIPDNFDEEIALAIDTPKGIVVVTGCSHTGVLNIVNTIQRRTNQKVYAVLGGFHLLNASEEQIQGVIDRFKELGVERIGMSHCSGPLAGKMFIEQLPDRAFPYETGCVFEID